MEVKDDRSSFTYKFLAGLFLCFSLNIISGCFIGAAWLHFSAKFDELQHKNLLLSTQNSALLRVSLMYNILYVLCTLFKLTN